MAHTFFRRVATGAFGTLLITSSLTACRGNDDASGQGASDSSVAAGSVAVAKSDLGRFGGGAPPTPAPFQHAILAKPNLTFADYESAMQAMARCVEERVPGGKVTLRPSEFVPDAFDVTYAYRAPAGQAPGLGDGEAEEPSMPATPSASATSPPASSSTDDPDAMSGNVEFNREMARCSLEYSAYVEDRWRGQQVLSAAEVRVQKPQFLDCLTAAGVKLPTDTGDDHLGRWLNTPDWFDGLTTQQNDQANACTTKYYDLVNTIAN